MSNKTFYSVPADAPNITSLNSLNSTAISVQWSPPLTPNGVIIFYTIYISGNAAYNITTNENSDNYSVQNFTVVGLSPNKLVNISLSANTKVGEGPLTEQEDVTTHESGEVTYYWRNIFHKFLTCLVPGRVENLEVVVVNNHTILVSWNPPLTPNGVLTGYEVLVENLINTTEKLNIMVVSNTHDITISSGVCKF